jgi:AmiR/NasT family two-component response regulator
MRAFSESFYRLRVLASVCFMTSWPSYSATGQLVKVLLADCNPTRSNALERELLAAGNDQIVRIEATEALPDAVQKHTPDLIIIDMDQAAVALFRHYQATEEKLRRAEAGLKERALIERAKGKLMREKHIAEPEAYHFLRRKAMDRGRRIVDIATEILDENGKAG